MKKTALILAMIVTPTLAFAGGDHHDQNTGIQYSGPVKVSNLTQVLNDSSMFTEQKIVVEGKLIQQLDHDTFIFSDGKAQVQVDLDDDIVLTQPLDASTQVRLFGEFEGGNTPEIEVDRIQVL